MTANSATNGEPLGAAAPDRTPADARAAAAPAAGTAEIAAHLSRAARYAALALDEPVPFGGPLAAVLVLRDDYAAALGELATALTGRGDNPPRAPKTAAGAVAQLARDPVGALVARLRALPALGAGWDHRPAPSQRWSGRPADPGAVTTPLGTWQGLAVETVLATAAASHGTPNDGRARWAALGHVGALADALSALDPALIGASRLTRQQAGTAREYAAGLGVAAREVAALAAGAHHGDLVNLPPRAVRPGIVVVSRLAALPGAITNLTRLLTEPRTAPGAAGVHAATLALARISLAAASALQSAAGEPSAGTPQLLTDAAAVLRGHGTRLRQVVEVSAARFATLDPGPPAVRDQAREILTGAAGRIRDLAPRPRAALAASPVLLEYAARVGDATDAIAAVIADLDGRGELLTRDRSEHPRRAGWVLTNQLDAAPPHIGELRRAATDARSAPTPRAWVSELAPVPDGPVTDLRQALARRRAALRPDHPATTRPPAAVAPQAVAISR